MPALGRRESPINLGSHYVHLRILRRFQCLGAPLLGVPLPRRFQRLRAPPPLPHRAGRLRRSPKQRAGRPSCRIGSRPPSGCLPSCQRLPSCCHPRLRRRLIQWNVLHVEPPPQRPRRQACRDVGVSSDPLKTWCQGIAQIALSLVRNALRQAIGHVKNVDSTTTRTKRFARTTSARLRGMLKYSAGRRR